VNKLKNVPCLIVTLYKSPNFGAYLQAFALQEVLTQYGYQVSFLDVYDQANDIKRYKFLLRGTKRNPSRLLFNLRKLLSFRKAEEKFNKVKRARLSTFHVAFVGSDEIWNVTNSTFNNVPEFFGLDLGNLLKFSYAPSAGNASLTDILCHPESKGLNQFDLLSVRDAESEKIAKDVTQRTDINLVMDPTFLYDFSKNEERYDVECRYLLVYTYGFSPEVIEEVKSYAKIHNLLIVSVGFHHSWVDRNILCNPFEFLSLVRSAECIVTDTFHGSIFAIKYKKNFISYGRNKKKVKYLLESLGLSNSLVDIGHLTEQKMILTDYSEAEVKIQQLIASSHSYLECCSDLVSKN